MFGNTGSKLILIKSKTILGNVLPVILRTSFENIYFSNNCFDIMYSTSDSIEGLVQLYNQCLQLYTISRYSLIYFLFKHFGP